MSGLPWLHVYRDAISLLLIKECPGMETESVRRMRRLVFIADCTADRRFRSLISDAMEQKPVRAELRCLPLQALDHLVYFSGCRNCEGPFARCGKIRDLLVRGVGGLEIDLDLIGGYRRPGRADEDHLRGGSASGKNGNQHAGCRAKSPRQVPSAAQRFFFVPSHRVVS